MEKSKIYDIEISDVSATLLLTLFCHALESQSPNPILTDPNAEDLMKKLNPELAKSKNILYRRLAQGKINKNLIVHISLRAKKYDDYVRNFLKQSPDGVVVNIGCGLDTRFWRIDNGRVNFYDLDLPEVIGIKKKLCEESKRYHMISSSVLDHAWMSGILEHNTGPFLFLAEGVFMYLNQEDVKALVLKLQKQFPGSELVCEVVNDRWLKKSMKVYLNFKMRRQLYLGKDATFKSGLKNSEEMENWGNGIKFVDEWSYFDSHDKKLGWLQFMGKMESFRKVQWTVHYKLN
jgi:methyltransferase (TIGR00027 family)